MSKRHQASRRKSYGRRQHEVRERTEHQAPDGAPSSASDREDAGHGRLARCSTSAHGPSARASRSGD